MNALVSGGADCGPVNPLSQLSKAYGQDRSLQQDHYGPQAGPSGTSFRRASPSAAAQDATRFFTAQGPTQPQPFDLSPLNRALSSSPAAPAWAQAFSQSDGGTRLGELGLSEQEAFGQAFNGRGGSAAPQWSGDFMKMQLGGNMQRTGSPQVQHQSPSPLQVHRPMQPQLRFGGTMPMQTGPAMFDAGHHDLSSASQHHLMDHSGRDWETAFSALESFESVSDTSAANEQLSASPVHSSPLETDPAARDALAKTAAELLATVSETTLQNRQDTVDKFAQSTFLDLMRKLRDGEVAVEGDKVVEQLVPREEEGRANSTPGGSVEALSQARSGPPREQGFADSFQWPAMTVGEVTSAPPSFAGQQTAFAELAREQEKSFDVMNSIWAEEDAARAQREAKGKGKAKQQFQGDGGALQDEDDDGVEDGSFLLHDERSRQDMAMDMSVPLASHYWDEDDFDPSMIVGGHAVVTEADRERERNRAPSAQQQEWEKLQNDWDEFEATSTGIASTSTSTVPATAMTSAGVYTFVQNNPYASPTRTHALHSATHPRTTLDSVLEHEAAVQREPRSPTAWLALGIKQQENEREELAIRALSQALELDPTLGEAYLALAVSFTNENERGKAYEAVDKWVDSLARQGRYSREVDNYRDMFGPLPEAPTMGHSVRHDYLTGLLIQLARTGGENVDAEVQIALGVLFNTSEEYDKASDCFGAALSVRPDDPLLFNRLGATLANSGKTDLSIQYYLEALELHPGYVRARFNLAVANMNLGHHEQAVEQLMTSLSIQEEDLDASGEGESTLGSGVTSQTLWDSLNIALLMMHRGDLAAYTSTRDLAALRSNFLPVF